jgi:hypothetical protein
LLRWLISLAECIKRETTKGDCDSYVKVDEEKRLTDILDCSTGDYRFCTIF